MLVPVMTAGRTLLDKRLRPLRDVRLSVTDRCNFRCGYCMPADLFGPDFAFLPRAELLTFEEIAIVARELVALGARTLRITGGEPLARRNVERLVALLRALDDHESLGGASLDLALTTNGSLLAKAAGPLRAAGLDRLHAVWAKKDGECSKVKVNGGISLERGCCNLFERESRYTTKFSCGTCEYQEKK